MNDETLLMNSQTGLVDTYEYWQKILPESDFKKCVLDGSLKKVVLNIASDAGYDPTYGNFRYIDGTKLIWGNQNDEM